MSGARPGIHSMGRPFVVGPFLFMLLLFVTGRPVSAQVRGLVVDSVGRPLADAVVDLWVATVRVGRVVTPGTGRFEFPQPAGPGRLVVRRIGSRAEQRDVVPSGPELWIVLSGVIPEMEPIVVDQGCGRREDKSARAAWERASSWYRELPDSLWLSSELKFSLERVARAEVGRPVIDSTGFGWGGYRGLARSPGEATIARSGYPAPDPEQNEILAGGLTRDDAQHFVTPAFGARVRFRDVEPGRIRFCPRRTDLPWIYGEMSLAEDGSLLAIWWRYGSTREIPATGGVATFVAPSPTRELPLLPSGVLVWQERPSGMAAQRSFEYKEWRLTNYEPHWR